jgi:rhamnosyltransferase
MELAAAGMIDRAPLPSSTNVCAVVVAFYPDEEFETRLQAILPQVARLVVVDNTPDAAPPSLKLRAAKGDRLHYIVNRTNRGLAAALNQGLEYALQRDLPWLLTLDQDTQCYSDMIAILGSAYQDSQPRPAVVGSNYFDPLNHRLKVHADEKAGCLEQKTVITSGSLVNVCVARQVKGFREDYFIDQLDHEFCLRVRAHGYRVVISRRPAMAHVVGRPGGARLPFLGILPNHPAVRKYYIARNTVVTVAEYWRREPAWCLRRLVRLLLGLVEMAMLEDHPFRKVYAFGGGVMDGLRRRMGPCQRESLYEKNQR